jgi:hypothetical protein
MTTFELAYEDWFPVQEWLLAKECSLGTNEAWEWLTKRYQGRLEQALGKRLGNRGHDLCLIDDLATDIWDALVWQDYRLLARFNRHRGSLATFLNCLAGQAVLVYHQRRHAQRFILVPPEWLAENCAVIVVPEALEQEEFRSTLPPRQQRFCDVYLLGTLPEECLEVTDVNYRALASRIARRCRAYSDGDV